jgi:biotin carboxylase
MRKRILMLGAGFMQGVAIRSAKERGWEVVAVDGNPHAVSAQLADRFEPIDLKDRENLASFALKLKAEGGLDGVFTAATDFSASVAFVARACGLPGHSYEAALNASDKILMRGCFERAGVPSPSFIGIQESSRKEALSLITAKSIGFPLVVKPADNMGARGCRKVESPEFLDAAIADAIRFSRTGCAIVEEYMDGPEFSLEALVYDGEIHMTGFADRHIFYPPYFIEMGHTIPTSFPDADVAALIDVFKRGIRALGLSHGVGKGDIKLTTKGPMVGEIAGRLSGGYMSGWTFPYSSGIHLTNAALSLAVGERPISVEPTRLWTSAERAWISIPGVVASVTGYEQAKLIPYVKDIFPRAQPGDKVSFPVNNVEKCGNCIAVAPCRSDAIAAAESACRAIVVRLSGNNPETDAFLSGGLRGSKSFPPDAFSVSTEWKSEKNLTFNKVDMIPNVLIPSSLVDVLVSAKDWQNRTVLESLVKSFEIEPGIASVLSESNSARLVRYWEALLRGGIQGILYAYDSEQN